MRAMFFACQSTTREGSIQAGVPGRVICSNGCVAESNLITQLKMRLATLTLGSELDGFNYRSNWPSYERSVLYLAALFISNVIRSSKIHLLNAKADEFYNRTIEWSATIGVPVKIFDSPALRVFENVFETAWLMAESTDLPVTNPRQSWEEFLACWNGRSHRVDAIEPSPELCGAIAALVSHPTAEEGIYLFFDVGGGTLDGVSFRYYREQGLPHIVLFDGRIEALGVESVIRRHSEWNADEMRAAIFSPSSLPTSLFEVLEPEADQIRQLVGPVVMRAKEFAGVQWRGNAQAHLLPVLVGGGGRIAKFYTDAIMSTHQCFDQARADIPPYTLTDIPIPDDFDMGDVQAQHFHRFAIAYGLSVPYGERPEIRLPSQVRTPDVPRVRPVTPVGVYDD